jgi:hypothetical protein
VRRVATFLVGVAVAVPLGGTESHLADREEPRTLILALDGVPFRVVERARDRGAFAGWPPTSRLIASRR